MIPNVAESGTKCLKVGFNGGKKIRGGTWTVRKPSDLQTISFGGKILVDVFVPNDQHNAQIQLGIAFQEMSQTKASTWQQQ